MLPLIAILERLQLEAQPKDTQHIAAKGEQLTCGDSMLGLLPCARSFIGDQRSCTAGEHEA